jgi:peptidoglycan/xylan/chitin deacetylase (PgdA/CDA1 family)
MQHLHPPYQILLSFDLEEFDIPMEYGAIFSQQEQLNITRQGMDQLLPVLQQLQVKATFFTTAFYATHNKEQLVQVARLNEIASHCFYHSQFEPDHIAASRSVLQNITGQPIEGFRMPRLAAVDKQAIREAGYLYDASLNPTWLPGRYNYLNQPRTVFYSNDIWTMPASVTPFLRIPLFWLAFKILPLWFIKQCSLRVMDRDGYLSLYFHPWEYADLNAFSMLPFYTRRPCGTQLLDKLWQYLAWLQTLGRFTTIGSYVQQLHA